MNYTVPPQYSLPPKAPHNPPSYTLVASGCLVLIAAIAVFLFLRISGTANGPSRAVRDHLTAINRGDVDTAYDSFTQEYRRTHPREVFRHELYEFADQLPCRRSRFTNVSVHDDEAEVGGTLTGRNGALFPIRYELIREKGKWKIRAYHWEPPGDQQRI